MFIWWLKLIFSILAISFLTGSLFTFCQKQKWLRQSQTAKGIIIDLVKVYSPKSEGGEGYKYFPIIEFNLPGSKEDIVRFQAKTGRHQDTFNVGNSVKVRYDIRNVNRADIDNFYSNWGMCIVLISMCIINSFFYVLGYIVGIGYM